MSAPSTDDWSWMGFPWCLHCAWGRSRTPLWKCPFFWQIGLLLTVESWIQWSVQLMMEPANEEGLNGKIGLSGFIFTDLYDLLTLLRINLVTLFSDFSSHMVYSLQGTIEVTPVRAVASLSLPGGQDKNISSIFCHFLEVSLIFPQSFFNFFLHLVFRVGSSPIREGPGYATAPGKSWWTNQERLKKTYLGSEFPSAKYVLRVCFKNHFTWGFTRMISTPKSGPKYKCPGLRPEHLHKKKKKKKKKKKSTKCIWASNFQQWNRKGWINVTSR